MAPVIQENKPKAEQPSLQRHHHHPQAQVSAASQSQSRGPGAVGGGAPRDRKSDTKSDLLVRVRYNNTLPDIPFDAKFLNYPFDTNRFVEYKPTSLEKNYKYEILTEHDQGVVIDLINPETYAPTPNAVIDPDDERILDEEDKNPNESKRSRHHSKVVPWLKKTEYISTEFNRYGASSGMAETKVGFNIRKKMEEQPLFMDREAQVAAIDKTFSEATQPILRHHSKPHLTPLEEMPVLPDFELWKFPFAHVAFDADPIQSNEYQQKRMAQALVKGMQDEEGQFVAYFLPTKDTLDKMDIETTEGLSQTPSDEYEYNMARQYTWNVKNKSSKNFDQQHFLLMRNGCAFYNELESKVRLTKRKLDKDKQAKALQAAERSILVVAPRDLNEGESRSHTSRLRQLEPPRDDEEDQEPEQGAFDEVTQIKTQPMEVKQERSGEVLPATYDGNVDEDGSPIRRQMDSDDDENEIENENEGEKKPTQEEPRYTNNDDSENEDDEPSPKRIKEEKEKERTNDKSDSDDSDSESSARASSRADSESDEVQREDPDEADSDDNDDNQQQPESKEKRASASSSDSDADDDADEHDDEHDDEHPDIEAQKRQQEKEIFGSDSDSE